MLEANEKNNGLELSDEWVKLAQALLKVFWNYFPIGKKLHSIKCIDYTNIIETAIIVPQKEKE